jgi:hypothetical protein
VADAKPPSIVKLTSDAATVPVDTETGCASELLLVETCRSEHPIHAATHPSKNKRFTAHLPFDVG